MPSEGWLAQLLSGEVPPIFHLVPPFLAIIIAPWMYWRQKKADRDSERRAECRIIYRNFLSSARERHIAIGNGEKESYDEAFKRYSAFEITMLVIAPDMVLLKVRALDLAIIEYRKARGDDQKKPGWKDKRREMQSALIEVVKVMRKDTLENPSVDCDLIKEFLGCPPD